MEWPPVTVVMPVRNEARFFGRSLTAVLDQDYPGELEIVVVDGQSTDGTRDIVARAAQDERPLRTPQLVDNPRRTVPFAMNLGLGVASGEFVIRVDGHCEIARDYVTRCVDLLEATGAECVGGIIENVGETRTARAIGFAQGSRFGGGGARFRTGGQSGRVDTVAFGAYRHEVFDALGLFDEELTRNQDDEFNFRLIQAGGTIWFDPSLRTRYYSRASLRRLWRQYYEYGFYKVRVIQKRRGVASWRHLVPACLVTSLGAATLVGLVGGRWRPFAVIVGSYCAVNVAFAVWTTRKEVTLAPGMAGACAIMHIGYGIGFLMGAWKWRHLFGSSADQTGGATVTSDDMRADI